jgi:hypothetical protein
MSAENKSDVPFLWKNLRNLSTQAHFEFLFFGVPAAAPLGKSKSKL